MLPTVGADTLKILAFAAEVGGRTLGVASLPTLVPDAAKRAALEASGNKIVAAVQTVATAYVARLLCEFIESRIAVGKGRAVDRGFEGLVSTVSETIRTSLPDRKTSNADYVAIFPNGAEEYTAPTIKEDPDLAADLRAKIDASGLAVKTNVIAMLDTVIPVVSAAATAVRAGEKKVNDLFATELNGRKQVVDVLWEERNNVENALGRGGRGLARFVFFDFRKDSAQDAQSAPKDAPSGEPAGEPPPPPDASAPPPPK